MPTINAGRVGTIRGTPSSNLTTARTSNGTTVNDSPTTTVSNAVMSFFSAGRGTILFNRTYVYFDTSTITSTPASAKIRISTGTNNSSDVIVMNGFDAFGGDGDDALATNDFNEVNMGGLTQIFSSAVTLSANASQFIDLNSTALSRITADDDTVMCLMNNSFDRSGTTPSSVTQLGIAFGTTMVLDYTVAATSDITSVNTITRSNITSFNTIALASIDEINGIDN